MGSLLSVRNRRRKTRLHVLLLVLMLSLAVWGCGSDGEGVGEGAEGTGEGAGEGVGEEGGAALAFGDMFDQVRKGARLIIEGPAFVGTVENTTTGTLQNVWVEVHLSNGVGLGPEVIGDMAPGEMVDVAVFLTDEALATPFDGWTPHAEVGAGGEGGGGSGS